MFINLAELVINTVHANDFSFFEELDELVQEEPIEALDAERAGQLAAIGLVNGQPFAPDERMRAILTRRRRSVPGIARTVAYAPRDPEAALYGSWKNAFVGGSYEFLRDGARLLDARTQFHYLATVITPAMAHAQVGAGSAYAYTVHDSNGDLLDGGRTYRLHVDAEPAGEELLGGRRLRHPDPIAAPGALDHLAGAGQQLRHAAGQRRRLLRPLLRPHRPAGQGVELGRDHPRQVLVPALPALRPARAMVRPDLEAQRVRTGRLTSTPAPKDTLIAYRSISGSAGKVCCCHSNREASSG